MSKLLEYISLIPRGIKNLPKIMEGLRNNRELDELAEDAREEIVLRRLICSECPFMSANAEKVGYKSDRKGEHCIHCGCPIDIKTASLSSDCGISTYNEAHPEKSLPLKWHKYEELTQ